MKYYTLFLHWKQGDEFNDCLTHCKGNVSEALDLWSEWHDSRASHCRELAKILKDKDIKADAGVHHIGLCGDKQALDEAVKQELITEEEWYDEFNGEEDFRD